MPNFKITTENVSSIIPKDLFLVLGGGDNNTSFSKENAYMMKRIPEGSSSLIVEKREWKQQIYVPWRPDITLDEEFYSFNSDNSTIYICTSNNNLNRKDLSGNSISTIKPTHYYGHNRSSDGYEWLAIATIGPDLDNFITDELIPIPNYEEKILTSTITGKYSKTCGSGVTTFGTCCLYYRENYSDPIDSTLSIAGDLTGEMLFGTCFECQEIADRLQRDHIFISGISAGGVTYSHALCDNTKTIYSLKTRLEATRNNLGSNSSEKRLLDILDNHTENSILNININLNGLTKEQKIVNSKNPRVVLIDPESTTDAQINLTTVPVSAGKWEVTGISITSRGAGYKMPSWYIEGIDNQNIVDAIDILPYPTEFFNKPYLIIPTSKYMTVASISEEEIVATLPITKTFTKIALTKSAIDITNGFKKSFAPTDTSLFSLLTDIKVKSSIPVSGDITFIGDIELQKLPLNKTKQNYEILTADISDVVYDGELAVEGYRIAARDIEEPVESGDILIIENEEYEVFDVTSPIIKKEISYFSQTPVNISISNTPYKVYSMRIIVDT